MLACRLNLREFTKFFIPLLIGKYHPGTKIKSPIHLALDFRQSEILDNLIPLSKKNWAFWNKNFYSNPMVNAIWSLRLDLIKKIEPFTDLNSKIDISERSYLHVAAMTADFELFKYIYQRVQDKYPKDFYGKTPYDLPLNKSFKWRICELHANYVQAEKQVRRFYMV